MISKRDFKAPVGLDFTSSSFKAIDYIITELAPIKRLSPTILIFFLISRPSFCQSFRISNVKIKTRVFKTINEQTKGLSGVKNKDFTKKMAALFYYKKSNIKQFWMLNTFFNLDIFFLDKNYKIIAIDRNLPFYIGDKEPDKISRSRSIHCRHVLEMRADSKYSKKLKKGMVLNWEKPLSF